jgi:hypothetical protein
MESPKAEKSFCLQDYLPQNLICDMNLLDESINPTNLCDSTAHPSQAHSCQSNKPHFVLPNRLDLQRKLILKNQNFFQQTFAHFNSLKYQAYNHPIGNIYLILDNFNPNKNEFIIPAIKSYNQERLEKEREEENKQTVKKKKLDIKLSEFLKSQKGSRIYQRKLKKATPEELNEILFSLKDYFGDLLTNVYGNYFCQKLYTVSNTAQRKFFLESVNFK